MRICASLLCAKALRYAEISFTSASLRRPAGRTCFATRSSTRSACFRSATAPSSTGKLRPISAGSMSIWISRAGGIWKVKRASHELQALVGDAEGAPTLSLGQQLPPEIRHRLRLLAPTRPAR